MEKFHFSQFELNSNKIFVPDQNFLKHIDLRRKRKSDTAIEPEAKNIKFMI